MIRAAFGFSALTALLSCADETLSGYGASDTLWVLQEIDGAGFEARVTLEFPEEGTLRGQAPCNSYTAEQRAPYPWVEFGPMAVTRKACPELDAEQVYLTALQQMTQVEVLGNTMILRNEAGVEMVFEAR